VAVKENTQSFLVIEGFILKAPQEKNVLGRQQVLNVGQEVKKKLI